MGATELLQAVLEQIARVFCKMNSVVAVITFVPEVWHKVMQESDSKTGGEWAQLATYVHVPGEQADGVEPAPPEPCAVFIRIPWVDGSGQAMAHWSRSNPNWPRFIDHDVLAWLTWENWTLAEDFPTTWLGDAAPDQRLSQLAAAAASLPPTDTTEVGRNSTEAGGEGSEAAHAQQQQQQQQQQRSTSSEEDASVRPVHDAQQDSQQEATSGHGGRAGSTERASTRSAGGGTTATAAGHGHATPVAATIATSQLPQWICTLKEKLGPGAVIYYNSDARRTYQQGGAKMLWTEPPEGKDYSNANATHFDRLARARLSAYIARSVLCTTMHALREWKSARRDDNEREAAERLETSLRRNTQVGTNVWALVTEKSLFGPHTDQFSLMENANLEDELKVYARCIALKTLARMLEFNTDEDGSADFQSWRRAHGGSKLERAEYHFHVARSKLPLGCSIIGYKTGKGDKYLKPSAVRNLSKANRYALEDTLRGADLATSRQLEFKPHEAVIDAYARIAQETCAWTTTALDALALGNEDEVPAGCKHVLSPHYSDHYERAGYSLNWSLLGKSLARLRQLKTAGELRPALSVVVVDGTHVVSACCVCMCSKVSELTGEKGCSGDGIRITDRSDGEICFDVRLANADAPEHEEGPCAVTAGWLLRFWLLDCKAVQGIQMDPMMILPHSGKSLDAVRVLCSFHVTISIEAGSNGTRGGTRVLDLAELLIASGFAMILPLNQLVGDSGCMKRLMRAQAGAAAAVRAAYGWADNTSEQVTSDNRLKQVFGSNEEYQQQLKRFCAILDTDTAFFLPKMDEMDELAQSTQRVATHSLKEAYAKRVLACDGGVHLPSAIGPQMAAGDTARRYKYKHPHGFRFLGFGDEHWAEWKRRGFPWLKRQGYQGHILVGRSSLVKRGITDKEVRGQKRELDEGDHEDPAEEVDQG
jgi:hypothetical protein